jgi:hypothetical protein
MRGWRWRRFRGRRGCFMGRVGGRIVMGMIVMGMMGKGMVVEV